MNEQELITKAGHIRELAKENPLDVEIFKFIEESFNIIFFGDIEEAENFLDKFIMPFAKEKKCLTDFRQKKNKILRKIQKAAEQALKEQQALERKAERAAEMARLPNWIWIDDRGKRRLNEIDFIEDFSLTYQLKYFSGCFFGIDGRITNIAICQKVQSILGNYFTEKIAQMTKRVVEGLQNKCYCEEIEPSTNKIHISNGYLRTDEKGLFTVFIPQKEFCLNRLNVKYTEEKQKPKRFLKYLSEVYKPEDIRTIQQFLGYCLLPTNRLQLCLILNGEGGEGKTQLGQIFSDIIGEGNIIQNKLQKVQERFGLANCSNKLVFLDDDLDGKALIETGNFKTLVTSKGKLEAEMKNVQQNSGQFYIRFICFSNRVLQSLYDQTEGFYRRLLVLQTKPKDKSRITIRDLGELILKEEKTGVFQWLIDGLNDLISNDWNLYISENSQSLSETLKRESDSVELFFTENPYIILGKGGAIHTADLYTEYIYYCGDNALKPISEYVFPKIISERQKRYNIQKTDQLTINGKRARGYKGITFLKKHTNSTSDENSVKNSTIIKAIS